MKRPLPLDRDGRFRGHLRHYHRSGGQPKRTWDEWIDGAEARSGSTGKWFKIVGIAMAVIALGGIIVGLIIELR